MRDDELLAIYAATRQLAEGMTELKQSTAALEATIAQVRQLPAMLGQQTSKYIAAGIREVVASSAAVLCFSSASRACMSSASWRVNP